MNFSKYRTFFAAITLVAVFLSGCSRVLDKPDLSAIPEAAVWNDVNLATAYVNQLYVENLPGWPTNKSSESDEAGGSDNIMHGQLTINSIDYWPYNFIRNINILLRDVGSGSLTQGQQNILRGQALFMRAWQYFQLVNRYGGVPLVLDVQELSGDLEVSRSKTSECITQIVKDLDDAAMLLPGEWLGSEDGRVTSGAALALKGRVLLHFASERFDPTQSQTTRWTDAYNANKAANTALIGAGKALMPNFKDLWFVEGNANTEAVLVKRFNNPGLTHNRDACTRPLDEAQNCTGADQPSLSIVSAFPMKNGLPITDPASGYDAEAFWLNRDPRFGATIAYNGALWELSGKPGRIQWTFLGSQQTGNTNTGFFTRKGIQESYKPNETELSGVDWIEIRYAEVLLNLAEAANEVDQIGEAYDVLKAIRERAGIEPGGNGLYGLKAGMSKSEMRAAILLERRIELAFEGKRPDDMRRRRLYGQLNGTKRQGYIIDLIGFGGDKNTFYDAYNNGSVNLDADYNNYFDNNFRDLDLLNTINFKNEYYFYAIPMSHIEKNSKLEQTSGWEGGNFDPLQ